MRGAQSCLQWTLEGHPLSEGGGQDPSLLHMCSLLQIKLLLPALPTP